MAETDIEIERKRWLDRYYQAELTDGWSSDWDGCQSLGAHSRYEDRGT